MATFGFIGTGNMGGALARAAAQVLPGEELLLSNRTASKAEALAAALGCKAASREETVKNSRFLFLGVKPQGLGELLPQLAPMLPEDTVLVSMAAGVEMAQVRKFVGRDCPVIRIMPNTPVSVGSGVILYDATENVSAENLEAFCYGMSKSGYLDRLPEALMDAGTAVAGCGPAFVCLFMEALADQGVACGLPRDKALQYAARMVEGTAKLLLETGSHPGLLKDGVCSPGGSTIAGVRALEQKGFRGAAMSAVEAAYLRTKELGK